MQNISFAIIVSVLLSCAFFFSQQTQSNLAKKPADATPAAVRKVESLGEVPACPNPMDVEQAVCYQQAATLTGRLVEAKSQAILALETDPQKRIDFLTAQQDWEDWRDSDCAFARTLSNDPVQESLAEQVCLRDHNQDRLAQLDQLLCEYYDPGACPDVNLANP